MQTQERVWENLKVYVNQRLGNMLWCHNCVCIAWYKYSNWPITCRPFRLTRAIARVSTHANLSARAICRTHEKSYSAEKVLFHWIFFFQSFIFIYERHLWIIRYMSIAYHRCWLRWPERRPKRKVSFIGHFCVGFQFRFVLELPKLILYTILNVKFLPFWKKFNCFFRKRDLLSRDDLVLPWKPLYEIYESIAYSKFESVGLKRHSW